METMYERIKRMTKEEMKTFIYMVYLCGNEDGRHSLRDSSGDCSYFGGAMLEKDVNDVMPNDDVNDIRDTWLLNS